MFLITVNRIKLRTSITILKQNQYMKPQNKKVVFGVLVRCVFCFVFKTMIGILFDSSTIVKYSNESKVSIIKLLLQMYYQSGTKYFDGWYGKSGNLMEILKKSINDITHEKYTV